MPEILALGYQKKQIPQKLLEDLNSFLESESVDMQARAIELAHHYGISVSDILSIFNKLTAHK